MRAGPAAGRPGRTFIADVTAPTVRRNGFDAFRRAWDAQMRERFPLPLLDVEETGDFRINVQAVTAHDVVIAKVGVEAFAGRTTGAGDGDDRVLIHLMRQGSWHFTRPDGRDRPITASAGSFIARRNNPSSSFDVDAGAVADVLILPTSSLAPLISARPILGSARSAEVRLLTAHARMVVETVRDLTPAGVRSARDALLELARGALRGEFDDAEPLLAPALARAAMRLADDRLTDPGLGPSALARELHVSVRTMHRAFATVGESVAGYVRRRRLERARLDLAAPHGRPTVSDVAARWHFADSSHFIRAFKRLYGQTPGQFVAGITDAGSCGTLGHICRSSTCGSGTPAEGR
ncbi:helix-turn-helix domain-containing protein [Streptomyces sp. NPDC005423]|uniref:helix-turn-helix domain-containing protein n=1 Tax=Streptomyces sp. NPDC005423 TaxID=3155343 RepID=UPI00339E575B